MLIKMLICVEMWRFDEAAAGRTMAEHRKLTLLSLAGDGTDTLKVKALIERRRHQREPVIHYR